MNANQVNILNIGLMIAACVAAFIVPFELLLFSYTILGPLHYLTEVGWLHKRGYFTGNRIDYKRMGLLTLAATLPALASYLYISWGPTDANGRVEITEELGSFFTNSLGAVPTILFVVFAGIAMFMLPDKKKRMIGYVLIGAIAILFHSSKVILIVFGIFLPTIFHVFVFTGAFILVGALKSKSRSGLLSLFVFIACALCLIAVPASAFGHIREGLVSNYNSLFYSVNYYLLGLYLHRSPTYDMVYHSAAGTMVIRFLAFAYTYHYLNWFSITSIIKWHKVPLRSWIVVLVIWVASVALYLVNFQAGLMALYFLSYLHVISEFPLNFLSFKEIVMELKALRKPVV